MLEDGPRSKVEGEHSSFLFALWWWVIYEHQSQLLTLGPCSKGEGEHGSFLFALWWWVIY